MKAAYIWVLVQGLILRLHHNLREFSVSRDANQTKTTESLVASIFVESCGMPGSCKTSSNKKGIE